jgi:glutathione synthase/RimK-type ligase-like ATP-grasp enzyme
MTNYNISLLTDSRYVSPDTINPYVQNILTEDILLTEALEARGVSVNRVDWADKNYDWSLTDYAIFRTTWDYFERFDEFINWLDTTKEIIKFINPVEMINWNLDKHYLQDLAEKGINIPPTIFIETGTTTTLRKLFEDAGWPQAILKPAVSGAARHTYRLDETSIAPHENIFQELIAKEVMLLQPFQRSVLQKGEVALMFFNGKYSHAVLKVAKPGDFRVQDDFGGTVHDYTPTNEEIILGEQTLQACTTMPVYARVDIIEDNNNVPAVSELEIIEPELWFRFHHPAASKMADAIFNYICRQA